MNPRKEATYRMLSLIAAVIFVLPCVFLVFPIFDINPDDLWQMDSLMEFICAYKNTAILAIVGVLIQIVLHCLQVMRLPESHLRKRRHFFF